MTVTPEIEKAPQSPKTESVVQEIPEKIEVSEQMQEQGVTSIPQIPTTVNDDQGKPLAQAPSTQTVTIQLPASPTQLHSWSQGSPASSLTWLAVYWLRLVKKALLYGWRVVMKGGSNSA